MTKFPGAMRTKFMPTEFLMTRRPPVDDFGPPDPTTDPPTDARSAAACTAVASGSYGRPPAVATTVVDLLAGGFGGGLATGGATSSFDPSVPWFGGTGPTVTRESWSARSAPFFGRLSGRVA